MKFVANRHTVGDLQGEVGARRAHRDGGAGRGSALASIRVRSSSAWSRYGVAVVVDGRRTTPSSARRTNIVRVRLFGPGVQSDHGGHHNADEVAPFDPLNEELGLGLGGRRFGHQCDDAGDDRLRWVAGD